MDEILGKTVATENDISILDITAVANQLINNHPGHPAQAADLFFPGSEAPQCNYKPGTSAFRLLLSITKYTVNIMKIGPL
tara:strand:+ start:8721 stop:8960 length:240 start_codon:yes stop_codon:yes gene_type:complete